MVIKNKIKGVYVGILSKKVSGIEERDKQIRIIVKRKRLSVLLFARYPSFISQNGIRGLYIIYPLLLLIILYLKEYYKEVK